MAIQNNYFTGKKILITGITGFIGAHLEKKLSDLGADVYGISSSKSSKNIIKANILDYAELDAFIKDKGIEICYHLAGESIVESGQRDPYHTFKINIDGTLTILECAKKYKFEKLIIASTVHVYGNNKVPYLEEYTPKPSRPYETSKACSDLITQSYADTFKLPVFIPRFVNIYGPGDLHFTRVIPKVIKAIISGEEFELWGGKAVREYLFIDDAINAYLLLAEKELDENADNRIFNFGSSNETSVENLIEKISNLAGKELKIKKIEKGREDEITSQYVSSEKAKKLLSWKAKISLDKGLGKTYDWYKKYFEK